MRHPYYILRDKEPAACPILEWSKFFEKSDNRRVAEEQVGDFWISTVFLGIDHSWGFGTKPILFESMVFDETKKVKGLIEVDGYTRRYSTWKEAENGHRKIVRAIRAKVFGVKCVK